MVKKTIAHLVEKSLKKYSWNHDGYSESGRSPEESVVNGPNQCHVVDVAITAHERKLIKLISGFATGRRKFDFSFYLQKKSREED